MIATITQLFRKITAVERSRLLIYIVVYLLWGILMNAFGTFAEIAKFTFWWQIISCYILYMIPISLLLRGFSFFNQYCYGLLAMGILEFAGYALQTSYVFPDNILIQWFGPYTFALGMTLFFGLYFPFGNALVHWLYTLIFRKLQNR